MLQGCCGGCLKIVSNKKLLRHFANKQPCKKVYDEKYTEMTKYNMRQRNFEFKKVNASDIKRNRNIYYNMKN